MLFKGEDPQHGHGDGKGPGFAWCKSMLDCVVNKNRLESENMRKISYMYDKSGGTNRFHECSECLNYVQPDKNYNYKTCALHPERPMDWKPDHMACKFFSGEKTAEEMKAEFAQKYADMFHRGKSPSDDGREFGAKVLTAIQAGIDMGMTSESMISVGSASVSFDPIEMHQMTIDEWIEEEGI